jgi:putative ABC transport system substrate-binding protein
MLHFKVLIQFALERSQKLSLLSFCVLLQFFCAASFASDSKNTLFIVSKDTADYIKIVELIKVGLGNVEGASFSTVQKDDRDKVNSAMEKADLIVTLGSGAADVAVGKKTGKKLVAALITESAFMALAEQHYGSQASALASGISVIVLDQPLQRRLKLASILLPESNNVGLMLGPSTQSKQEIFTRMVKSAGMTPDILSIGLSDNPIHKIDPVMKNSDVFIPIADSHLINVTTAKWILQLSYRYRVAVIGYSANYVNAGALASVYSSPEDVARQTSEVIQSLYKGDAQYRLHLPKYCTVKFNKTVAWHLGLQVEDGLSKYRDQCGI